RRASVNADPTSVVTQTDSRGLIRWNSFTIANGETLTFNQPGATSIAFNVVAPVSGAPPLADIEGSLKANGGVWLYDPGGVLIGPNAHVDVGSFLATTGTTSYAPSSEGAPTVFQQDEIEIFGATNTITVKSGATINASHG